MKNFDFFTVLFASVVYFVLYNLWYSSFLFKKIYNFTKDKKQNKKKNIIFNVLIFTFIFVMSYIIASFEILLKVTTFKDGLLLGFLFWLSLVLPQSLIFSFKHKKPLKLFLLDNALYLIGIMTISSILAG